MVRMPAHSRSEISRPGPASRGNPEGVTMIQRRQFLHLAAAATAAPATSRIAKAQTYPARSVRLIVGSAAGGSPDIIARLMGQWLSERLGQAFVIENRSGAGGNIGTEAAVRAPSDGYTLLLVPPSSAINATLYDNLTFNFLRDLTPVAGIASAPNVLVVTRRFRRRRSRNSSPTPRPIPAGSTWRRPAPAALSMSPANCSR